MAQTTVSGKVTNELGEPMSGVTVKEKGTQNAVGTDAKGTYSLTVSDEKAIVEFSFIGYETQDLKAKDIPSGSVIILKSAPQNLQEVVINKGFYSEKQELSTGDVSVVSAKTIEEQPVSDPTLALIAQVPGLNIQQASGIPGSYATINIRGLNSIANGNNPYYVVDGVPFSSTTLTDYNGIHGGAIVNSPFNALNPNDIESIEVLKDADATAIYGSKGANGVIIITTKKGKAGETKVNVDLNQGIGQVPHFIDLLNSQQYLQMRHEAFANDGIPFPSLANNPQDNNYDVNGEWDTTRYTNWQKVLIGNTAHYTNAQASISGGNANTQFLIGAGYNRATTVFPGDFGDKKGSLHFSLTNTSSNQKFKTVLTASYVNDNNNVPNEDLTSSITLAPDAPAVYGTNGLNWQVLNGTATWNNPLAYTLTSYNAVPNNLVSNLNLSYQLMPGLLISSSFGYNHDELNQTNLVPATAFGPPDNMSPYANESNFATNYNSGWIIEPQLSYQRKISKGNLNVLVGGTLQQNTTQYYSNTGLGYTNPGLISNPEAADIYFLSNYQYSVYRYEALVARIGYTWDDKYLLNLTANRDGSSRFGPDHQYGNFGSVGAGWIFSKEKAVTDAAPWLSFGKLRFSYGTTGNDQIGDYQYLSTYSPNSTTYQGISGLNPTALANPNFSWEVDKKLEGGFDMGFLKDNINVSLSYYRNRTANQLVGYPLPSVTGFTSIEYNLPAVVQNTGFEASIHTVNIKSSNFSWTTLVNFTAPENKLVSFPGLPGSPYAYQYVVGQSLYIREAYDYTGVNPQTGLYTFKTADAGGVPSYPTDIAHTPPLTQKFYGGIGNNFTYKSFGLDIFIQFVKQLGYNPEYSFLNQPGTFNSNQLTSVLGAWQKPGQTASVQLYGTESNTQNLYSAYTLSNAMVTDASFIRIKNVELYYRFPASWQGWANMQNARIYIRGQNLFTFTGYKGLDPENAANAQLVLPSLRVIMLGVSALF